MKFFDTNPPGRIISRISKDIEMIDDYVPWVKTNQKIIQQKFHFLIFIFFHLNLILYPF